LVVEGKLRIPGEQFKLAVGNLRRARLGAYLPSLVYGGTWLALYLTIPQQLASVFVSSDSAYHEHSKFSETVNSVLWISGIGQLIDDIRQVQMGDLNGRKSYGIANWLPTILNFGLMLATGYALAFSADQGAVGLETSNAAWFFVSLFAFQALISRETNRLLGSFGAPAPHALVELQDLAAADIGGTGGRRASELPVLSFGPGGMNTLGQPLLQDDVQEKSF
jgi:hypothetical protein